MKSNNIDCPLKAWAYDTDNSASVTDYSELGVLQGTDGVFKRAEVAKVRWTNRQISCPLLPLAVNC